MKLEGFLFDLDGVVIDSEPYNDKACALLLETFGKKYDRDAVKPLMVGKSDVEGMEILVKYHKVPISGSEFDSLRRENKKHFYEEEIPYMKGFLGFYSKLLLNYPLPVAIATACNKEYFDLIDKRLKISELFNNKIFRSDTVARHKPYPDIYLHSAKQIGINCESSIVFEDAPSGIVAGLRAGARIVALTTTFSKKVLLENISKILGEKLNLERILFINDFSDENYSKLTKFLEKNGFE
ncbi:MAG: HAD family phosphatase [archaeon]|jgi:HAD superfamily hydrolase (TIGR01509 family)